MRCDILKGASDRGTGERVKGGYFGGNRQGVSVGERIGKRERKGGAKSNKGKGAND